jgi:hypothetical protein
MDSLEWAIQVWRDAINRISSESPLAHRYYGALGVGFHELYLLRKNAKDLEEAIQFFLQAIDCKPEELSDRLSYFNGIGVCYADLYGLNKNFENLEKSISYAYHCRFAQI